MQPLEDPPSLIADAPGLQIWHKLDRTFKRPIALAYLCITPRCAYNSARTAALTHLALKLLQDDVNETAYLADVAGLGYDVSLSRQHPSSVGSNTEDGSHCNPTYLHVYPREVAQHATQPNYECVGGEVSGCMQLDMTCGYAAGVYDKGLGDTGVARGLCRHGA